MKTAAGNVRLVRLAMTGMQRTRTAVGIQLFAGNDQLACEFGIMGKDQAHRHDCQQHDKD